ncbi:MAG: hypothetical protein LBO67_03965 [Spirochaetaceae bacterium]|jgi:hypothetical protein|nr:hypothetical protein [Spirochaetaceae bacterium]
MKNYRDEIAMVCHEIVKDGQTIGLISKEEIREFEENCFIQEPEAEPVEDVSTALLLS